MEQTNNTIQLPPGFRFHPTDEELIVHYLQKKVTSIALPASIFAEIELYKFDPWELPYKALFGEDEWYFFSPRDRKYPNGVRPNRMARSGYWKATGTDRPIVGSLVEKVVGVKKGLVFYKGRPPRGVKTDWIMDEYRLLDTVACNSSKPKESMRLDDWVLCRVRQKTCSPRNFCENYSPRVVEPKESVTVSNNTITNPNFEILKESILKDCPMLPFMFGTHLDFPYMNIMCSGGNFEGYDKRYREEEGFINSNKKLRTMEGQNCQNGEALSLGIETNDMSFCGGLESDIWEYI